MVIDMVPKLFLFIAWGVLLVLEIANDEAGWFWFSVKKRTCQLNGEIEEKNGEDAQAVDILKTPQDTPQHVEH